MSENYRTRYAEN